MAEVTINGFLDRTFKNMDEKVRALKTAVFSQVIVSTRVDTGRMAGNWQITSGAPAAGTVERLDPNYQFGLAAARSVGGLDEVSYLTNNLDYAWHWNQVDGYVDLAIQSFHNELARL